MYQMVFKYAASALLVASLFWLTLSGKMDNQEYILLATNILVGLGAYHAGAAGPNGENKG